MSGESANYNTTEPSENRLSKRMQRAIERRTRRWKKAVSGPPSFDPRSREKERSKHSKGRAMIRDMYHRGDWPGTKHPEITTQFCRSCDERRTFINGECGTCRTTAATAT